MTKEKKEKYVEDTTKILDALDKLLGINKNEDGATNTMIDKVKEILTDANGVAYDPSFAIGTYSVVDIMGTVIARAWLDDKGKVIICTNEHVKRMN